VCDVYIHTYIQAKQLEEDNAKLLEQLNSLRNATADLQTAAARARAIRDDELRCVFVLVVLVWVWVF
jgi:t-SNARE complex subunit (syntaxin)